MKVPEQGKEGEGETETGKPVLTSCSRAENRSTVARGIGMWVPSKWQQWEHPCGDRSEVSMMTVMTMGACIR